MMKRRLVHIAMLAAALMLAVGGAQAQSQRDTERRLERVRNELGTIANERRRLESDRGEAAQQLREVEEKIGRSSRALAATEAAVRREEKALSELQQRRDEMQRGLAEQKEQLAAMLRAAYALGSHAPLKLLLAQDRIASANRALTYHRYAQHERTQKMAAITADLHDLQETETQIAARRTELEKTRQAQRRQLAQLQEDRQAREKMLAELEKRYQDRNSRERALGRDARALEQVLASLRAAAAKAEAERRAAAAAEAAREMDAAAGGDRPPPPRTPVTVALAPAPKVGGMDWPTAGDLLAGFGGKLPDGRTSSGVLIGAPLGAPVNAVADGAVVFSEWMTGYGLILIIDHGNGYMSLYAHNDALLHDTGDAVKRGDPVAKVGSSGGHGRPALYFELRQDGKPVDPASWLQRR